MEMLKQRSPREQIVLGGAVLFLIFSFFDWQQVCAISICAGRSAWDGVGVIAGLLAFAVIGWELVRALGVKVDIGSTSPALISVVLALALLLFTVITFLTHNEARHWPAWIGLILSIVIAAAAFLRGKDEGVKMPDLGSGSTGGGDSAGGAGA